MKKWILTLSALLLSITCSANLDVVKLNDLTESQLEAIQKGEHPEIAVEFSENSLLPLTLFLEGNLIHLEADQFLDIKETFYARYVKDTMLMSTDLTKWQPVAEFITGEISCGFGMENGKPFFLIGAEINRR